MNQTIDGFCDHTAGVPDEELHQHYADLMKNAGVVLYGRVTYQLMEYWKSVIENPTGEKGTDEFARVFDKVPKLVFSRTLKNVDWHSAQLATRDLAEELRSLKQQPGKDIFVGSPGLISQLTQQNLIDEYQLCVHPVILGGGLPLFRDQKQQKMLKLQGTKRFNSGAIILYYKP